MYWQIRISPYQRTPLGKAFTEKKMKFKIIEDLTSDVMFEAYGKNLKELFENSALALFSIMCKVEEIKGEESKVVNVKGSDVEDLMINWLQELIGLVDTEEMFFSKFKIEKITETNLKAKVYGEEIRPEVGEVVVKAVTYYGFNFEKTEKGYKVKVSLDV